MIYKLIRNILLTKKQEKNKRKHMMDNVVNSMFNSQSIYNQLKIKCHPDRFPNDEKKREIAEHLFQEVQKNRYNVEMLKELEYKINHLLEN